MKGKPKTERLNKLGNQLFDKFSKDNAVYLCIMCPVYAQHNQAEMNNSRL